MEAKEILNWLKDIEVMLSENNIKEAKKMLLFLFKTIQKENDKSK